MMDNLILRDAKGKITKFDRIGLHYNLVAEEIYRERRDCADPFSQSFARHIIAGLISFDMGRMMGKVEKVYDFEDDCFGSRLDKKLSKIRLSLEPLMDLSLAEIELQQHEPAILKAYNDLSPTGEGQLNMIPARHFHVGATKILHFLNPELFIIVDSNAARAFEKAHGVSLGHSSPKYLERMKLAKRDIQAYGLEKFKALDPGTPITRIYDKLTFMTGQVLKKEALREDTI